MTYVREFPDMPEADMPPLPDGWEDTSWHNDACPSYTSPKGSVLWIDYVDPARREFPGTGRFMWSRLDDDGCHVIETELYDFDDWQSALLFAAQQDEEHTS